MNFFLITNSPDIALFSVANGVNQIFVDLEINGKLQRQGHLDTVISRHSIEDVQRVRSVLPNGHLLVRINPIFEDSAAEIDAVIKSGADTLMLPMFKSADEVKVFTAMVAGRARCCLLVETVAATENIEACLKVPGVDQVHIGLNDLHLELGKDFMFEPLANGMLEELCAKIRKAGIPFGIGGVARIGEGMLPAELLLGEHVRLGSSWAILSRTFHRQATTVQEIKENMDFGLEITKLREKYVELLDADSERLTEIHLQVKESVRQIVRLIRTRKGLHAE